MTRDVNYVPYSWSELIYQIETLDELNTISVYSEGEASGSRYL